jgi:hypothetical protein
MVNDQALLFSIPVRVEPVSRAYYNKNSRPPINVLADLDGQDMSHFDSYDQILISIWPLG